jgi:RNA polymerase sigma-70 factor, ECF subfamily
VSSSPVSPPKSSADPSEPREFAAIYAQYFAFVWRCLQGLGVPRASLDDAAQEVFVVVHRRLCEFRGEASLRTWLYGIVRNVANNQRRSERRRAHVTPFPHDQEPEAPGASPHERAQDREAAEFVQAFLAGLSDKKRDVFVLALLEQMPIPEVAETLGLPLNTAYSRLRDLRIEFKRALANREQP